MVNNVMATQARKIRLAPKKAGWQQQFGVQRLRGTPLAPPIMVSQRYGAKLRKLIDQMYRETRDALTALFEHPDYAMDGYAEDASIASRARIVTNNLTDRFESMFGGVAKKLAEQMVDETDKSASTTLKGSLKELSGGLNLRTDFVSEGVNDAIQASVAWNVDLIKKIPQQFMSDVTGAVMKSITNGRGLADLQPFMREKYGEATRRADLTAMDQTRKAYTGITTARMDSLGIKKFEWVHTAGSKEPRKLHEELNGQIFDMDDLPVIDSRTGERGLPGQAPNCRCIMRPVIDFD